MEISKSVVRNWLACPTAEPLANVDSPSPEEDADTSSDFVHRGFLTDLFHICLANFKGLQADVCANRSVKRRHRDKVRDVYHKLSLLSDAFEGGKLESCLSIDGDLHQRVTALLYDIGRIILKGKGFDFSQQQALNNEAAFGQAKHVSRDSLSLDLEQHLIKAKEVLILDTSCSESSSGDDSTTFNLPTPTYGLGKANLRSLSTYVGLLMDLCPTLEQAYRDQYQTRPLLPQQTPGFQVTLQAMPYVHLVRDKFPLADKLLVERLGEANWQRHERLRAFEESEQLKEVTVVMPLPAQPAKSNFQPMSIFKDSALGSSVGPQSEKAQSVASHSSFVSSNQDSDNGRFRVPRLPTGAAYGELFLCPFCQQELDTIKTRIDWKLHVFLDLQAYICLSQSCSEMLRTFPSRKAWFEHESVSHLSVQKYHCQLCVAVSDDEPGFFIHSATEHGCSSHNPHQRRAMLSAARKAHIRPADNLQCPLCRLENFCTTHRDFAIHVGRHMEEVALSSLPRQDESDEEGQGLSDSEGEQLQSEPGGMISRFVQSSASPEDRQIDPKSPDIEVDQPLDQQLTQHAERLKKLQNLMIEHLQPQCSAFARISDRLTPDAALKQHGLSQELQKIENEMTQIKNIPVSVPNKDPKTSLQDYQLQLILLEEQNKKKHLLRLEESIPTCAEEYRGFPITRNQSRSTTASLSRPCARY